MRIVSSPYGKVCIGSKEALFEQFLTVLCEMCDRIEGRPLRIGLTGGAMPKAFYQWCCEQGATEPFALLTSRCIWSVSDERYVSFDSPDSNFGNADRLFLQPLKVPDTHKMPWPVALPPKQAAAFFSYCWGKRPCHVFDVCFLGMGEDGHTASLFPGSPLLKKPLEVPFAAVEVPHKGWRLTITTLGLAHCQRIVVGVLGGSKSRILGHIFNDAVAPGTYPIQSLKPYAKQVIWCLDEAAAAESFNKTLF